MFQYTRIVGLGAIQIICDTFWTYHPLPNVAFGDTGAPLRLTADIKVFYQNLKNDKHSKIYSGKHDTIHHICKNKSKESSINDVTA